jgi:cyclopropane-fatty-acyl-phospholipid synthase
VARLYDARFVRMWECYLAVAETVFEIQLAKRQGVVPITRDYYYYYIAHAEARLRALEAARRVPMRLTGRARSPANARRRDAAPSPRTAVG